MLDIKLLDSGKPAKKVAELFSIGKPQIQNLRKRKLKVLNGAENNEINYFIIKIF